MRPPVQRMYEEGHAVLDWAPLVATMTPVAMTMLIEASAPAVLKAALPHTSALDPDSHLSAYRPSDSL
jgi:hypothetical protein